MSIKVMNHLNPDEPLEYDLKREQDYLPTFHINPNRHFALEVIDDLLPIETYPEANWLAINLVDRIRGQSSDIPDVPMMVEACAVIACRQLEETVILALHPPSMFFQKGSTWFINDQGNNMINSILGAVAWKLHIVSPFCYLEHLYNAVRTPLEVQTEVDELFIKIMLIYRADLVYAHARPSHLAAAALSWICWNLEDFYCTWVEEARVWTRSHLVVERTTSSILRIPLKDLN